METELINLISNNVIGVLFGILMYKMANDSIKENNEALQDMNNTLKELIMHIKK
jgi:hypothetical protein